ncbi:MAG: hypothetical protein QM783_16730 [Phycisphaerales bacterium]
MLFDIVQSPTWGTVALGLLSLIFLANTLGVIDQRTAVRELAATGLPERFALLAVCGGRLFQLVAVPALFFTVARPFAAVGLAGFLVPATLTAHAFWKAPPEKKDMQLAGF